MMDPVQKIKDHVVALNKIGCDDESGLDRFIADVKGTIKEVFHEHSHYMTFLGAINLRPVSVHCPSEDSVRSWGLGRKQLRDLLLVMLGDPLVSHEDAVGKDEIINLEPLFELKEAERIVSSYMHRNVDPGCLARIRIDLRDVNILDKRVEQYLVSNGNVKSLRVLLLSGTDDALDDEVLDCLDGMDAEVVRITYPHLGGSLQEQLSGCGNVDFAVVTLAGDCRTVYSESGKELDVISSSPSTCFALGYLVSYLGRSRVFALYRDEPRYQRPTHFYEVLYMPVDKGHMWRREFSLRFHQHRI
ncbi:MAG: hypothetical protein HQL22_07005 [Candidatus Omnitrophica bacterium]|nr:hypothetical protein [Candidatus Omnitrophota bacterium]